MKKQMFILALLLFVPLFAAAQNSLDQANNVRSGMNGNDNSSTAPSNPYMGSSGAGSSASGNVPNISRSQASNTNSGVTIDEVAAGNPGQDTSARDKLQAEQDLRASREKDIISYCTTVLITYMAMVVALNILRMISTKAAYIAAVACLAVMIVMLIAGFIKIFQNYPDGINPSGGVKAVCTIMLGAVVANEVIGLFGGGIGGLLPFLITGLGFIVGGNKLAKSLMKKEAAKTDAEKAKLDERNANSSNANNSRTSNQSSTNTRGTRR